MCTAECAGALVSELNGGEIVLIQPHLQGEQSLMQ